MNGRVYDPKLGRMLSPDPVTQAPENGQNYNRFSYAYNNPLKYTDPSGFETEKKNVLVDGNGVYGPGPMEHINVTAPAPPSGIVGNQAALAFAGNGGNSPQPAAADRVENAGQPVANTPPTGADEINENDAVTDYLKWLSSLETVSYSEIRTDIASHLSLASVVSADLSLPALALGQLQLYAGLQIFSLTASVAATALNFTDTNLGATSIDVAAAYLVIKLGVYTTPAGRVSTLTFETGSAITSYLFYEASKNDNNE